MGRKVFSRVLGWLAPALLLGGCGKAPDASDEAASGMQAPDVTRSSAASGVAFTFDYTFMLPARAISKVQRQHVTACEQLGMSRCRITGITFNQNQADDASGSLSLLLEPAEAYRFSGNAVQVVEAATGEIAQARVEGRDAAGSIEQAKQGQSTAQSRIAGLEARLRQKGLSEVERSALQVQLEEQRGSADENAATGRESRQALAVTPVSFRYYGQGALAGEGRFGRAARESWNGLQDMLILVLVLLGYMLPWVLVVGMAYYLVQRFKRARAQRLVHENEFSS